MERYYSNAAGATLLKSLSAVDIVVWMLQEIRRFFLKNTSERFLKQIVPVSVLWFYKYYMIIQTCIKHLVQHVFFKKNFALDVWLVQNTTLVKKLFKVLVFLKPLIELNLLPY